MLHYISYDVSTGVGTAKHVCPNTTTTSRGCSNVSHTVLAASGDVGHDSQAAGSARGRMVIYGVALPRAGLPVLQVMCLRCPNKSSNLLVICLPTSTRVRVQIRVPMISTESAGRRPFTQQFALHLMHSRARHEHSIIQPHTAGTRRVHTVDIHRERGIQQHCCVCRSKKEHVQTANTSRRATTAAV